MKMEERPDKRRTVKRAPGEVTNFTLLLASAMSGFKPDFDKVTSVSTIAFLADGRLVLTEENRGPDVPGGHVQEGEEDAEETARREALEEAGITLGALTYLGAIQSDHYGTATEDLTYMVMMTGLVEAEGPVPAGMKKHIMTVEEFKASLRAAGRGIAEILCRMVDEAYALLFGNPAAQA